MAYVGRYGHQQGSWVLDLPLSDFYQLVREVGELLDKESPESRMLEDV